jgi:hypothetical protein
MEVEAIVAVRVFALSCLELQALAFSGVMLGEGRASTTLLGGSLKEVVDIAGLHRP